MKGLAIAVLSLIFGVVLLCVGILAFAQEPPVPPVIMKRGLIVESCEADLVTMVTTVADCKTVKTTQQYSIRASDKERIRTIHVRCQN